MVAISGGRNCSSILDERILHKYGVTYGDHVGGRMGYRANQKSFVTQNLWTGFLGVWRKEFGMDVWDDHR